MAGWPLCRSRGDVCSDHPMLRKVRTGEGSSSCLLLISFKSLSDCVKCGYGFRSVPPNCECILMKRTKHTIYILIRDADFGLSMSCEERQSYRMLCDSPLARRYRAAGAGSSFQRRVWLMRRRKRIQHSAARGLVRGTSRVGRRGRRSAVTARKPSPIAPLPPRSALAGRAGFSTRRPRARAHRGRDRQQRHCQQEDSSDARRQQRQQRQQQQQ
mmetsp:Transcript_63418/g.169620  ORF Transcript_63418/g.169620 Transcript_63418/m.169620 type:complete len:214 (-) Transcript_63418:482-1123(-)